MSLVVVGSVAFDSIKTPGGAISEALGGSATHFSLAASLFTPVRLVGVVGGDFPSEHLDLLRSHGIDLDGLEVVPDGRTFRWSGEYFEDMNQRETLSVELNVLDDHQPKLPDSYRDSRFLFLGNGPPVTQASVLDQMTGRPFVVADTMDLWIQTAHRELLELLPRLDGLVLNDQEAFLLSDDRNLVSAGRKILEMGPNYVVVKKGEHGSLIFHRDGEIALPGQPLGAVVDPTGAGDSFAGGLMGFLSRHGSVDLESFKTAVAWGTVTASFCCEAFGVDGILKADSDTLRGRFEDYRSMLSLLGLPVQLRG
ncbi:MAG: PfkB family carbohydrate kinase [Planctomycetota bacterium]